MTKRGEGCRERERERARTSSNRQNPFVRCAHWVLIKWATVWWALCTACKYSAQPLREKKTCFKREKRTFGYAGRHRSKANTHIFFDVFFPSKTPDSRFWLRNFGTALKICLEVRSINVICLYWSCTMVRGDDMHAALMAQNPCGSVADGQQKQHKNEFRPRQNQFNKFPPFWAREEKDFLCVCVCMCTSRLRLPRSFASYTVCRHITALCFFCAEQQ